MSKPDIAALVADLIVEAEYFEAQDLRRHSRIIRKAIAAFSSTEELLRGADENVAAFMGEPGAAVSVPACEGSIERFRAARVLASELGERK